MIHVDSILDVECGVNQLCPFCDNEMMDGEQIELITAHGVVGCAHSVCIAVKRENERESWHAANLRALWKRKHISGAQKDNAEIAATLTDLVAYLDGDGSVQPGDDWHERLRQLSACIAAAREEKDENSTIL